MLNLKRFNEGTWCDVPEEICSDGVSFKIRPLHGKQYMTIRESCKKGKIAVMEPDGKIQIVDDYDEAKIFWFTFSHLLEAWKGITIPGAKDDEEIREEIFNRPKFRDFINEMAAKLLVGEEKAFEEELKNSVRSQNGS
jgi:hypothetical protein